MNKKGLGSSVIAILILSVLVLVLGVIFVSTQKDLLAQYVAKFKSLLRIG